MSPQEFERHVHSECLRILRCLVKKRYDTAGERVAALALLAEERDEERSLPGSLLQQDPYDLNLLKRFDGDENERDH